jgi:hypothetical protein
VGERWFGWITLVWLLLNAERVTHDIRSHAAGRKLQTKNYQPAANCKRTTTSPQPGALSLQPRAWVGRQTGGSLIAFVPNREGCAISRSFLSGTRLRAPVFALLITSRR